VRYRIAVLLISFNSEELLVCVCVCVCTYLVCCKRHLYRLLQHFSFLLWTLKYVVPFFIRCMFRIELLTAYLAEVLLGILSYYQAVLKSAPCFIHCLWGHILRYCIALKCNPRSRVIQHGTFELDVACITITFNSSVTVWGRSYIYLHTLLFFMM